MRKVKMEVALMGARVKTAGCLGRKWKEFT
jgi:hypothetical protein